MVARFAPALSGFEAVPNGVQVAAAAGSGLVACAYTNATKILHPAKKVFAGAFSHLTGVLGQYRDKTFFSLMSKF